SVGDFLARIRIPTSTHVTITSSHAEVPITFRNDTGQPVTVHVRLESEKLLFPEGPDRDVVLPPRVTTIRFAVETRSSGTFPLAIAVTTSGGLPVQSTEMTVRSTFVSGVGIFLTVGAAAFLLLWWAWDIRRRRRARRQLPPVIAPA